MSEHVAGGGFTVARKMFRSNIWLKPPLYLKVWLWIIGRASHSDHKKNNHTYKRGEFVTTYDEIIKATAYRFNRRYIFPTLKQIRMILEWLESEGMIIVRPIKDSERLTRADTRVRTRAYVGLRIFVIKYDTYQNLESYRGRHKGRPSSELGHNNKNGNNNGKNTPSFFSLRERYDQALINKVFEALASTRKSGKISDSVLLAQLQKWDRYPTERVEAGIRTFLEKDYGGQGKREEYLLGIIRNQKNEKSKRGGAIDWRDKLEPI